MRKLIKVILLALFSMGPIVPALNADTLIEDFSMQPETRWRFFSDNVMGGKSSGQATILHEDNAAYARMTGRVSTANNGGFIQMRLDLPNAAPDDSAGVRLEVRGNDQRYFVHLRTGGTILPWQYYQAGFDVIQSWTEVRIPFTQFAPSGALLRSNPRARSLTSIAIVAYGRDHNAEIDVRMLSFY